MKRTNNIEKLILEEKKRITDIVNDRRKEPFAVLTLDEEEYDDQEQRRILLPRQKRLDKEYIDNKIMEIFKSYNLNPTKDGDISDNSVIWAKLALQSEKSFWKNIIDKLPFVDVLLVDSNDNPLLKSDDIQTVVGEGTYHALKKAAGLDKKLEGVEKDFKILKGFFFDYVLGYNEHASTYFLTLMVHYHFLTNTLIPVTEIVGHAKHDDKGSCDIPLVGAKYEIMKTYQYFTLLDLFRNNETNRYLFYQQSAMDESITEPLVIQMNNDDTSKRMIVVNGNITRILKFYHNNKILLYVETVGGMLKTLTEAFILKISCDDLTIEKVSNFEAIFPEKFNDIFYIDSNRIYESRFCCTMKPSPTYNGILILDIRKMFYLEDKIELTEAEIKEWRALALRFTKKELDEQKDIRRYEALRLRREMKPANLMMLIDAYQDFLLINGGMGTLYYDSIGYDGTVQKPMTDNQLRVLGCKVVSLPTHRDNNKYVIIAILTEKYSTYDKQLVIHFRKYEYNIQNNKYTVLDNPVQLDLKFINENGRESAILFKPNDIEFKVHDFELYFFNDSDTFSVQIFFERGGKFYTRHSTENFEKFFFNETKQGEYSEITVSRLIPSAMSNGYKIIRYEHNDPLRMKFDHIFIKQISASNTCNIIFAKVNTQIVVVYQMNMENISINDILSIVPLANQQEGFAYMMIKPSIGKKVILLKINNGGGYVDYDPNEISFISSSFTRFSLNGSSDMPTASNGVTMKRSNICSLCGNHTTKLDNLTHNYYCDSFCQLLFCTTKRLLQ